MVQTTSPSKCILILGGSYGGISSAHYILKHVITSLPNKADYQVTLVSISSQILCRPACPRALISDDLLPQQKLFVDIMEQFREYPTGSLRFLKGKAIKLDHAARSVSISLPNGTETVIPFHALVIATGASTPSPLHGLNGKDEESLRKSWSTFRGALSTAKHIVVAGGGPTAIETAGELGEYLNGGAGWFSAKQQNPKCLITIVTSGAQILPALRQSLATKAEGHLAQLGVTVIKNNRVQAVEPPNAGLEGSLVSNATLTLADGKILQADLYIPATGTKANTNFIDETLLKAGRLETNSSTLRVDTAGPLIYAIGDVASYARPAVHGILNAVPVVAANLKTDLLSTGEDRTFEEDTRETQLVPIGQSKGVGAAMGYQLPSWLVWLIKGRDYWLWTTGKLWSGEQWTKES
ncbi:unnamed protein product [Penicillium olsonii]|uniref:FAD/NAD(P)-binding domain-containing protein n=1 Tax=Penicillium olsonii TaxID=99116 RepID=A0A9W4MY97_PENOL|nr:unnamed protein product [Penicillium olsonii]CAG8164620.1 unnamed protein product [Penicillium olsonii]